MTQPDLWPIFASVFGPMLVLMAAMMRYLHLDILKVHKRIDESDNKNRNLIEQSSKESRELIEKNRELIEKNHRELATSLGEVRERLAHIEGHLKSPPPPAPDDTAAEAA